MQAPYDLISQYWPLEEQETLYRNSKTCCLSFFVPIPLSLVPSPDQLVVTQFPHRSYSETTCPYPIPVNDYFDAVLPNANTGGLVLSRKVFAALRSLKSRNVGSGATQASSISNWMKFPGYIPPIGNMNSWPVVTSLWDLSFVGPTSHYAQGAPRPYSITAPTLYKLYR